MVLSVVKKACAVGLISNLKNQRNLFSACHIEKVATEANGSVMKDWKKIVIFFKSGSYRLRWGRVLCLPQTRKTEHFLYLPILSVMMEAYAVESATNLKEGLFIYCLLVSMKMLL
jgi:hypothetical protein